MNLIPIKEAKQMVMASVAKGRPVALNLKKALNLVCAEDVISKIDIPHFANSQMDGFALSITKNTRFPLSLDIVETVFAGNRPKKTLDPNSSARIFTGAMVPGGANAVAMQENCEFNTTEKKVTVNVPIKIGENIRPVGDDIKCGTTIAKAGDVITPAVAGLMASCGISEVKTIKLPKIGILSTGSELMDLGKKLAPAKIYDSNRVMLINLIRQMNLKAFDFGIIKDDAKILNRMLKIYSTKVDVLIITGGVSVGDADFVKTTIKKLCPKNSSSLQLAIKPAKPFAFGTNSNCVFFGLPGNPVSAAVSFELLVKPTLMKMTGHESFDTEYIRVLSKQDIPSHNDFKTHYLRANVKKDAKGNYVGNLVEKQGSHNLFSLAYSNALAEIPNRRSIKQGQYFKAILINK